MLRLGWKLGSDKQYNMYNFCLCCMLRILAMYEAKTAKNSNFWMFWSTTLLHSSIHFEFQWVSTQNLGHMGPMTGYGGQLVGVPNQSKLSLQTNSKWFQSSEAKLWPTTLTYNPSLARVKVNQHAKNQGQRSNGPNRRVFTSKQTGGRMLPNVLSSLLRSR